MSTEAQAVSVPIHTHRTTCRACSHPHLLSVLNLGDQYLVRFVPERDDGLPKAPLELVRCEGCGLLQLADTVEPDLLFREFWYRSSINQSMRDALAEITEEGLKYHQRGTWLDIGANDGYLLSLLSGRFRRIACEPALNFASDLVLASDAVVSDYFSAAAIGEKCEVITSAAMFYDLDDPNAFVADIAKTLTPDGVWINQLNDAPTMLKANAFDAICHEHLCYYDVPSLAKLYRFHGLTITNISHNQVNGGSMRITARLRHARNLAADLGGLPAASQFTCWGFAQRIAKWKREMRALVGFYSQDRPLWAYGASTKGSVLLQYLDMNDQFFAIADRNPLKHGLLMAGSWLPITDELAFRAARPQHIVALPWAFRSEFLKRERDLLDRGATMIFPLPNIEIAL